MKNLAQKFAVIMAIVSLTWPWLCGCHSMNVRAKGGAFHYQSPSGQVVETKQPENPKDSATQDVEIADALTLPIPAGAIVEVPQVEKSATGNVVTNVIRFTMPTNDAPPVALQKTHSEKSMAKVGASQLDTVGAQIAKLKSTKWWSVLGFILFVGGVFAALYPPATAIFGGPLPGVGIAASGLLIAVLPVLLIGHEALILVFAAVAVCGALAFWFAHNHGGVMAELKLLKSKI